MTLSSYESDVVLAFTRQRVKAAVEKHLEKTGLSSPAFSTRWRDEAVKP
mgnify:CR=1 FL=1